MKRIYITESQFRALLESECYLNKDDNGTEMLQGDAMGRTNDVAVDTPDSDNVVTADRVAKGLNHVHPFFRRNNYGIAEEQDLDNQHAMLGKKAQSQIQNCGGGKLANNIVNRMNNDGGQRLNTTEVEISRIENKPQKNIGDKVMLKSLKGLKMRQRNGNKSLASASTPKNGVETLNPSSGQGGNHHSQSKIYYQQN